MEILQGLAQLTLTAILEIVTPILAIFMSGLEIIFSFFAGVFSSIFDYSYSFVINWLGL